MDHLNRYYHMKHIQYLLFTLCLLFVTNGAQAQLAAGRTKTTVIADALAQLPAETPQQYNEVIADLVTTGEEGLLELISRMNPPGKQSNEAIEFAISGWTHYTATDNASREATANAFQKALAQPLHKEIKAFVVRQLRTIATDNNVAALALLLSDDYLVSPAAATLVSIGTDNASQALLAALQDSRSDAIRIHLVNALGQTKYRTAEPVLLDILKQN